MRNTFYFDENIGVFPIHYFQENYLHLKRQNDLL